jgi:CRISPR-associated endonuclease Csn1
MVIIMSSIVLGLDLGTNSIGWALISPEEKKILAMGSRIIPMGAELSKFAQGQAQTKNANRRIARGTRNLNKRYKQRRNKLIYVLQELGMLPSQLRLSQPFTNPLKIDRVSILPIEKKQKQYSALDLLELRVKALRHKITLEEFGKIIYLFNQMRGYAGGGNEPEKEEGDEEQESDRKKNSENQVIFGKIVELSDPELITYKNKPVKKYKVAIETEDGVLHGDTFLETLKLNESLELLVNITTSKKYGDTTTFKLPNKTSWRKKMENLEKQLSESAAEKGREIYLSEYFLEILKKEPWAKIRNNVILRSRYQSEFDAIWREQSKHFPFLNKLEPHKLSEILQFLFPGIKSSQIQYREEGLAKGLYHIVRNQIIYYQRELKDQTHLISDCRFEKGEKVIAKSHPIFQEYKIWEQINKLTINTKIENGKNRKGEVIYAYEDKPISASLKEWLYAELQNKKEIGFNSIFSKLKNEYNLRENIDFLNGLNTKAKLKGNETRQMLRKAVGEKLWENLDLETVDRQIAFWDILYNGKGNEYDLKSDRTSKVLSFLTTSGVEISNPEQLAIQLSKIKFSRNYSAQSLKAIEKLLPLVRSGIYFNSQLCDPLKEKIDHLLNETVSDPFEKGVQEFLEKNEAELLTNGGIMNSYATILVYGKHTAKEYSMDETISDYKQIKRLPSGDLRNPLVEQIVNETLVIVKDIWRQFGKKPDKIRLELSRDLKNNAERRAKMYSSNRENQKANEEVKNLLFELRQDITLANIEKYKLWLSQESSNDDYVSKFRDPSKSEIEKMKLWKEQGHVSPYTGQPIPLAELFNRERYDLDHIIPQSRYFDDSFANKIICEKAINKDKGNKTAMEYFESGSAIPAVLSKIDFIDHVNRQFKGIKRKNLLATKVPEDPVARQLKETQYISVRVKEELSKIVGNGNVKTTTGGITDYLRNHWGLTDKFKSQLKERYEKIQPLMADAEYENYLTSFAARKKEIDKAGIPFTEALLTKDHVTQSFNQNFIKKKNNKWVIKGWTKRIDHRHHAIDALVVACTEPVHIKRLNDLNKELQNFLDNKREEFLPGFEGNPSELLDEILNLEREKQQPIFRQIERFRNIEIPWNGFPEDASQKIKEIIVSQKPKDKLLIQADEKKGNLQIKIRGQLHEGTLYGKSQGIEAYRIPLSKLSEKKIATEKVIEKIVDDYLKMIIRSHLKEYENKKEEAFSAEGILNLNKKLASKKGKNNRPAPHTPISSIKVFYRDPGKQKKKKGQEEPEEALQKLDRVKAYNKSLFVKTGDNYLFAILNKEGKRVYDLVTFFDAANLLKNEFNKIDDKDNFNKELVFKQYFEQKNNAKLIFTLKQGDAVYVPLKDEEIIINPDSLLYANYWGNTEARGENIHYVTKYSGRQIYFIKHNFAIPILKGKEFGSQNAYEKIGDHSIKDVCIKLNIDRLGNISPAI